ncbi:MAG: hypothetical protein JOZ41_03480 [Chloroflexi bacterium]|nr:hypothetical protein [Chloroflexota bacterium]
MSEPAGRVDMHAPSEGGAGGEHEPMGRSIATWLVAVAALLVMVLALLLIFHNAFRIG